MQPILPIYTITLCFTLAKKNIGFDFCYFPFGQMQYFYYIVAFLDWLICQMGLNFNLLKC